MCVWKVKGGRAGRDGQTGGDRETDERRSPDVVPPQLARVNQTNPGGLVGECVQVSVAGSCGSLHLRRKKKKKGKKNAEKKHDAVPRERTCVLLEPAVLGAARSCRVAELLQVGDAVEVNERTRDHQDVEQLVGVELEERRRGEELESRRVWSGVSAPTRKLPVMLNSQ